MSLIALVTWITTAGGGLYLLSIWLIEYDKEFQSVAATRLPPAVLTAHVLLALGGLFVWIGYVIADQDRLAWIALGARAPGRDARRCSWPRGGSACTARRERRRAQPGGAARPDG